MRSPNKSRSRNKNQNRRSAGNVINRVFDSTGPDGKVRGTPQQIIDKYQALARDAQLSGDRVAAENYLQHAEHYARILGEALREQAQRREAHEAQQAARRRERQQDQQQRAQPAPAVDVASEPEDAGPIVDPDPSDQPQPDIAAPLPEMIQPAEAETGAAASEPGPATRFPPRRRTRRRKSDKTEPETAAE